MSERCVGHVAYIGTITRTVAAINFADGEGFANARLIAAAPDLLEACRLIDWAGTGLTQEPPVDPVYKAIWEQLTNAIAAARTAIAKAEGSTPAA